MHQAFFSEVQKLAANNFAAIFFWPAPLHISPLLGLSLYFGGVWACFPHACPGNALCMEVLGSASGACLRPPLSQKSWESWMNQLHVLFDFFRATFALTLCVALCFHAYMQNEGLSILLWKPWCGGMSPRRGKVGSWAGAFGYCPAACPLSCWGCCGRAPVLAEAGWRSGCLLSFGRGFCKSLWEETWRMASLAVHCATAACDRKNMAKMR